MSLKLSPLFKLDELAEKFRTSADRRFSANSNDNFVLVEFSKNKLTIFLPLREGTFLIGLSNFSLNVKAVSIIY